MSGNETEVNLQELLKILMTLHATFQLIHLFHFVVTESVNGMQNDK
jgi:hypothetical protein